MTVSILAIIPSDDLTMTKQDDGSVLLRTTAKSVFEAAANIPSDIPIGIRRDYLEPMLIAIREACEKVMENFPQKV